MLQFRFQNETEFGWWFLGPARVKSATEYNILQIESWPSLISSVRYHRCVGHTQARSYARQCTSVNRFRMTGTASNRAVPSCIEENYHIMQICARSVTLPAKNSCTTQCSLAVWKKRAEKPCGLLDESRWTVTHLRGRHVIRWNGNTIYSPTLDTRKREAESDIRVRTISSGRRSNDLSYVRYFTLQEVAKMNGSFVKIVSSRGERKKENRT